ncbi:MAG: restriction endonuclease [Clostridia bacterium]|nr:restriction endonuclease [Clostridia bacterium]
MKNIQDYRIIYRAILDALDGDSQPRRALIDSAINAFRLSAEEIADKSTNGRLNVLRATSGTVINEMRKRGVITKLESGEYIRNTEKPVAIRMERCEEAILGLLADKPMSRKDIRAELILAFETDKTVTNKDDNTLFSIIGQILKRLVADGTLSYDGTIYRIKPEEQASLKNRREVLSLKADFLAKVHSMGGEFFEKFFMNLLARYFIRCGKTVTESTVTGVSADGGIDGIIKTTDTLGFKETIMVQTKNRNTFTTETDVRSFWGAVCAAQGTRGIYAIISDFHPTAKQLLDSIDSCVGVNGDKIFTMAIDVGYGIKRDGDRLVIDRSVLE